MARVQTIVQLSTELRDLLDAEAARRGVSRSELIRQAVESHLKEASEAEIGRQILEGYTRFPPGEFDIDEWGDPGAQSDANSLENAEALDEEERRAGVEGW